MRTQSYLWSAWSQRGRTLQAVQLGAVYRRRRLDCGNVKLGVVGGVLSRSHPRFTFSAAEPRVLWASTMLLTRIGVPS